MSFTDYYLYSFFLRKQTSRFFLQTARINQRTVSICHIVEKVRQPSSSLLQLPTQITTNKGRLCIKAPFEVVGWWIAELGVRTGDWILLREAMTGRAARMFFLLYK